ncbi:MAG: alpha/beta hydrolase, partial [Planctomycetes bacterium]|nr:alpha/beta hydrolase [Planctomycetota bacterium]
MKKRVKKKTKWSHKIIKWALLLVKFFLSLIARILFFPVFRAESYQWLRGSAEDDLIIGSYSKQERRQSKWYIGWRISRGIALRAVALPIVVVVCTAILLWVSLHPRRAAINSFPEGLRLYYEQVEFASEDGTLLRGWFIPSLNADEIADEGEKALRRRRPGVVLCHGLGSNRAQLLPLAGYLNRNGFEGLLFDFRNSGQSDGDQLSYGLHERYDAVAAVHYLASRASVDPSQIAVIGQDVGGVAALGSAALDHSVRAVVLAGVERDLKTAVSARLERAGICGEFCSTAYLWGYKTYFRAHDRQLSTWEMAESLNENQAVLIFSQKNDFRAKEAAA